MKCGALSKANKKMIRQSGRNRILSACKEEYRADLFEDGRVRQSGPKEGNIIPCCHRDLKEKAGEPGDTCHYQKLERRITFLKNE